MSTERWTAEERYLLDTVPGALKSGVELLQWWRRTDAAASYARTYAESFVFNRPEDTSFGFFDAATLSSGPLAVNGNVQQMFYDQPKSPRQQGRRTAEWMDRQIREFVHHYFLRISDFRRPQPAAGGQGPSGDPERAGFGFSQRYYQPAADGEPRRFDPGEEDRIVDLRRLGKDFDWIVLRAPIYDFRFELKPLGNAGPQLALPFPASSYLVLSPDLVVDESRPEEGVLGRYGFGYAFVRNTQPSVLAYGPGELGPAFELLVWEVRDNGEVTVRASFAANQPTAVLALSIDPVVWGFGLAGMLGAAVRARLAPLRRRYRRLPWSGLRFDPVFPAIDLLNAVTFGRAAKRWRISREQLKKESLFIHFLLYYQTLLGSLQTWRQVHDWLDAEALPDFVRTGRSS